MAITLLKGQKYGYFAATYKLQIEVWQELKSRIPASVANFKKVENRVEFGNGGLIEFWTLTDPDAGRSRKYHRVGIDEGGLVKDLEAKWHEAIRPTLADYRGQADFAGTPKGRNFFHTGFAMGQDPLNEEWMSWQMPTSSNPWIDKEEIEAAKQGMPERAFRQEFLAEFLEEAGGVFRGVSLVVDKDRSENEPKEPGKSYYMGVDLARVEDFTVIAIFDQNGRQVYFERFNQISWERQKQSILVVCQQYKPTAFYLDSTGAGDPIYEDLRRMGLPVIGYHFSNASKTALIDNLAMKIETGKVRLLDIQTQTDELNAYEYHLTQARNVTMSAPEGMHDDTVIALSLAAWGLLNVGSAENMFL